MASIKNNPTLEGKDLREIATLSLHCQYSKEDLLAFFNYFKVAYSKNHIIKILAHRNDVRNKTYSHALGF